MGLSNAIRPGTDGAWLWPLCQNCQRTFCESFVWTGRMVEDFPVCPALQPEVVEGITGVRRRQPLARRLPRPWRCPGHVFRSGIQRQRRQAFTMVLRPGWAMDARRSLFTMKRIFFPSTDGLIPVRMSKHWRDLFPVTAYTGAIPCQCPAHTYQTAYPIRS
jgi:hypothetical protein